MLKHFSLQHKVANLNKKLLKTRFVKQVYTLSTQDVTESTSESTDGSSTITTTLPPTTTTEIMIAADSSSEFIKFYVQRSFPFYNTIFKPM